MPERDAMSDAAGRILIVDDEKAIREALRTTLNAFGFRNHEAQNGEEALEVMRRVQFDVVLLDINMPGMSGIDICREIRRVAPGLGVIILTVRDSEDDLVNALEAGADDYITKPFHIRELTARLRAAVRRVHLVARDTAEVFTIGDIQLDPGRRSVTKAGRIVHVTPKEFDLLHYLMAHPGMCLTHSRLLRAVWGPEYGNELEYLRTFVRQLRRKIEDDPANPLYLLTDPYIGYRFCEVSLETSG
jgi:two-component system KDP operon response regulator KdpE